MLAYHAAYEFSKQGWEVLRLTEPDRPGIELLAQLESLPSPTLVLIDDAQHLNPTLIRSFQERAKPENPVMCVTNAALGDTRGVVHVSGERAVQTLASALRDRRDETLSIVRRFDPRIGDGWMETPLEARLREAEQQAQVPWQFCFILTGGETRARDDLAWLAGQDRADLLLSAIAARQLLTLDAGATVADLRTLAKALGRGDRWLEHAVGLCRSRRLVIGDQLIKCAHQRYAGAVLRSVFGRRDAAWQQGLAMLRQSILLGEPPLYGIAALLDELSFGRTAFGENDNALLDRPTLGRLRDRILAAAPDDVGGASLVLTYLRSFDSERQEWIRENGTVIGRWLTDISASHARSVAWLINDLGNISDATVKNEVISSVFCNARPESIARTLAAAPYTEWHSWGALLDRLWIGGREWCNRLRDVLPTPELCAKAETGSRADAHYVAALVHGLHAIDDSASLTVLEVAAEHISGRMNDDFPRSYYDFHEVFEFVLGYNIFRAKAPDARRRGIARRIFAGLNPERIATSICGAPRRYLSNSARLLAVVREASGRVGGAIIDQLDLAAIDRATGDIWGKPPHELIEFVGCIRDDGGEPSRSWISRHESEFEEMPGLFALIAPEVALRVKERGARVDIGISGVRGWKPATVTLRQLWHGDEEKTIQILRDHLSVLSGELLIRQSNQCDDLSGFVALLREIAPNVLNEVFGLMQPEEVERHWAARLAGKTEERRAAAALVDAAGNSDCLMAVAERLRARFPGASRLR